MVRSAQQIKSIREETGMNRREFSEYYGIPLRTLEDWEYNKRTPPEYVVRLLAYHVKHNKKSNLNSKTKTKTRELSVIKDINGNKIVVIDDIIFHNKQKIKWDDVEKYLEQYIGEFYVIAEDSETIYIGKDLPDEYANSKYTAKLKGALAKSKANATQAIPELIEIAENPTFTENKDEKHNKDAKYGWYRYDSRFAIAIYDDGGEIVKYNVFKVRMVIRYADDGKKYLYDLINIKKESEYPA